MSATLLPRLEPVGLEELTAGSAALLTRVDRKYVLEPQQARAALRLLPAGTRVLTIGGRTSFGYGSAYFDTPGLASFRAAATCRRRRWKVRTRRYLDTGGCWVEVKTLGPRGVTVKQRLVQPEDRADRLSEAAQCFVDEQLGRAGVVLDQPLTVEPVLHTRYQRSTVVLPSDHSRVTVDTDLFWQSAEGIELAPGATVVVETKTVSSASDFDRVLWRLGHRPTRISKFATGMVLLHPELPDHRWHRLVQTGPLTA